MANAPEIQSIIEGFVAQLTTAIQQQTLSVLQDALGGGAAPVARKAGPGRPPKAVALGRVARPKGAKRSPEELEQLSTQLAKYVKSNPGQRIEQIAVGLGTSTKELNLPAKKLIADKVLKTKGHKRSTQYFPV